LLPGEIALVVVWSGPYQLLPGTLDKGGLPDEEGTYLWVLKHGSRRLVHYIGYAESVRFRQFQHIVRSLGGGDWVPRLPVSDRIQNRYSPPEERGAANNCYSRLSQYVEALPGAAVEILEYLKQVEIFVYLSANPRDVEYMVQQHFMQLVKLNHPSAGHCHNLSLRGSRREDRSLSIERHEFAVGMEVAGLTGAEWKLQPTSQD
jgi:hypothetical protein